MTRLGLLLCALLLASCATRSEAQALSHKPKPAVAAADLARRIHGRINEERARHRLSPLAWDDALARIALAHSRDMAKRGYLGHNSPEGRGFSFRYREAGYACAIRLGDTVHQGAENVALNSLYASVTTVNGTAYYDWNSAETLARKVVAGWMQSPGHRKNILAPHWKREGVGVAIGADDKVYVTQNFC